MQLQLFKTQGTIALTRRNLLSVLCVLLCFSAAAQQKKIIIAGKVENATVDSFRLHWLENHFAERERFKDVRLDKKKKFRAELSGDRPLYVGLNYDKSATLLYVLPGDCLVVTLDGKDVSKNIRFAGARAEDNNVLQEYTAQFSALRKDNEMHMRGDSAKPYKAFRDTLEKQQLRFVEARKSRISPEFYVQLRSDIKYAACLDRITFVKRSRLYSIRPGEEESALPGYFDFMYKPGIINDSALVSPAYTRFLDMYLFHQFLRTVNFSRKDRAVNAANLFSYAKLVYTGASLDQELVSLAHFALATDETEAAGEILALLKTHGYDTAVTNKLEKKYKGLKAFGPGAPAPPFTLSDLAGKQVSLSDFKGKIVYLDFWASWCGPCMREMPGSAELKKKFTGQDVVFLYVSLDTDDAKWRKAITDKSIEGIHLIVGKSEVARDYSVNMIPRYVVIDKEGNLVDGNAARPSDKGTEELLKKLLAQ